MKPISKIAETGIDSINGYVTIFEAFHNVFSPRVKALDASDYVPDENETAE